MGPISLYLPGLSYHLTYILPIVTNEFLTLHTSTLKMEAACFSEMLMLPFQSTWYYNSEDRNLNRVVRFISTMNMEAPCSSETSVSIYQTTDCQKDNSMSVHRLKNLRSDLAVRDSLRFALSTIATLKVGPGLN
jgi:hypothetical protein